MSEWRKDPLVDRWVCIAPGRAARPDFYASHEPERQCPFCPGHEGETPDAVQEVFDRQGAWQLRVVPNRYPAFETAARFVLPSVGLWCAAPGQGAHEVVIESPRHVRGFEDLTKLEAVAACRAIQDRLRALSRDRSLAWAVAFKNVGPWAGASLDHTHSQLMATPMVPADVQLETDAAARHWALHGRCAWCELLAGEMTTGSRVIEATLGLLAWAPFASRWPWEMHVAPRVHAARYELAAGELMHELAGLLRRCLRRLCQLHPGAPYNVLFRTAPLVGGDDASFHWRVEILPRLATWAGFEWASGQAVNTVVPELAAAQLRAALVGR